MEELLLTVLFATEARVDPIALVSHHARRP